MIFLLYNNTVQSNGDRDVRFEKVSDGTPLLESALAGLVRRIFFGKSRHYVAQPSTHIAEFVQSGTRREAFVSESVWVR